MNLGVLLSSLAIAVSAIVGCKNGGYENGSPAKSADLPASLVSTSVSKEELLSAIESEDFDRFIDIANRIKQMRYIGDVVPVLKEAWALDLDSSPPGKGRFLAHPRIRLEIADILLQASKNGVSGLEPKSYGAYAREQINSPDQDVARQAILVLGVLGDPLDVETLARLVRMQGEGTFRAAASSLVRNCAVDQSYISTLSDALNEKNKEELRDFWLQISGIRKHLCTK